MTSTAGSDRAATKRNVETWGAFINGEFRPAASGKTFPTFNPGNGEIIGYLAECDEEDIDRAVRAALAAFPAWKKKTGAARAKLLMKLAQLVEANGPSSPSSSCSTPASRSATSRRSTR